MQRDALTRTWTLGTHNRIIIVAGRRTRLKNCFGRFGGCLGLVCQNDPLTLVSRHAAADVAGRGGVVEGPGEDGPDVQREGGPGRGVVEGGVAALEAQGAVLAGQVGALGHVLLAVLAGEPLFSRRNSGLGTTSLSRFFFISCGPLPMMERGI